MTEQLNLFAEENTLFNIGTQRLLKLDFAGCLETLGRYRKLYPWGRDVSSVMEMASFFGAKLGRETGTTIDLEEGARRYRIWREFEAAFGYPWRTDSIEEKLQVQYFSMLAEGLISGGYSEMAVLPDGTPVGLIYLLARRAKEAVLSLQASIRDKPKNAAIYGYLGDAYFLLGDVPRARRCYGEAFAIEPTEVDLIRLQDFEIKGFLNGLAGEEEFDEDPIAWFPVAAQLEEIFERRVSTDLDDLDRWVTRYLELFEGYEEHEDRALIPRLFYHAMVLSDNAHMLKNVKRIDLPEIRRNMKNWQPVLFARYMKMVELRG